MSKFHDMGVHHGERRIAFHCPGCECAHQIPITGTRAWQWNGSLESPTLKPSIFVNRGSVNPGVPACHSYVTDGSIQFLPDSIHALAGRTVELPDWEES